jgi:hypothetical protein
MPSKKAPSDTEQFSITLPRQAIQMIEQVRLTGLYGDSRGEITRRLVLARLEELVGNGIVKLPE